MSHALTPTIIAGQHLLMGQVVKVQRGEAMDFVAFPIKSHLPGELDKAVGIVDRDYRTGEYVTIICWAETGGLPDEQQRRIGLLSTPPGA